MIERLRQLSVGDLARADEDDGAKPEIGRRTVDGQGRRRVARAGTGNPPSRNHASMRECGGHAVVFEAAGGIHAFVLEPERAGIDADVATDLVGALEQGLAFADGDDLDRRGEREQLAEPPDAGEGERVVAPAPFRLEVGEPARARGACPTGRRRRAASPQAGQEKWASSTPNVAAQAGLMHCWNAPERPVSSSAAAAALDISRAIPFCLFTS